MSGRDIGRPTPRHPSPAAAPRPVSMDDAWTDLVELRYRLDELRKWVREREQVQGARPASEAGRELMRELEDARMDLSAAVSRCNRRLYRLANIEGVRRAA